jgi:hypothetical protein
MENKEIYTDQLTKGSRAYFFDIKKSEQGAYNMIVTKSKRTDEGYERYG